MSGPAILDDLSALADLTRDRLLLLVESHELTVSELCSVLQLPQSTVSRHLKALVDSGWLTSRAEGTSRWYAMSQDTRQGTARRLWLLVREQLAQSRAAEQDHRRLQSVLAARRSQSQEFFSSAAGQWDRMREELFGRDMHLRAALGLLDPAWVVGDLGCGTGSMSAAIAPFVARVIAVDNSAAMLSAAKRRLTACRQRRAAARRSRAAADRRSGARCGDADAGAALPAGAARRPARGRARAEAGRTAAR